MMVPMSLLSFLRIIGQTRRIWLNIPNKRNVSSYPIVFQRIKRREETRLLEKLPKKHFGDSGNVFS